MEELLQFQPPRHGLAVRYLQLLRLFNGEVFLSQRGGWEEIPFPELITDVAMGPQGGQYLVLGVSGRLYGWGTNSHGELSFDGEAELQDPVLLEMPETITSVTAGFSYGVSISVTGTVYIWGTIAGGRWPVVIVNIDYAVRKAIIIGSLEMYTYLLTVEGHIFRGSDSSLDFEFLPTLVPIQELSGKSPITTLGVSAEGKLYNLTYDRFMIEREEIPGPVDQISIGASFILVLTRHGRVFSWRTMGGAILGRSGEQDIGEVEIADRITFIVTWGASSYALSENGYLYVWGISSHGQLGIPPPGPNVEERPVEVIL